MSEELIGAVVFDDAGRILVREVVDHPGGVVWALPKTAPKDAESPTQTAIRAVQRRCGVTADPGSQKQISTDGACFVVLRKRSQGQIRDATTVGVAWAEPSEIAAFLRQTKHERSRDQDLAAVEQALAMRAEPNAGSKTDAAAVGPNRRLMLPLVGVLLVATSVLAVSRLWPQPPRDEPDALSLPGAEPASPEGPGRVEQRPIPKHLVLVPGPLPKTGISACDEYYAKAWCKAERGSELPDREKQRDLYWRAHATQAKFVESPEHEEIARGGCEGMLNDERRRAVWAKLGC